jgi:succinate dehydrogenase / fumarate reductase cytochrome b subunit
MQQLHSRLIAPRVGVFASSVGTKIVIGITGVALFLYLLIHIAGNLMVFFGPSVFNKYAHALEGNPLIPIIEIGLLLIFVIHVYRTVKMYLGNQAARPVRYAQKHFAGSPSRKTVASSTMIFSGLWLLVFIVIHVKMFRYGTEYTWPAGSRDLYRLEMKNFVSPLTVAFYVVSMLVVGSHLWHGVVSSAQSLGAPWSSRARGPLLVGKTLALLVAGGFIVITLWAHFVGGRL